VEQFVRNDLNMAVRIAVDAAAINGSGSGNVPEGILNVTGIGDVAGGTNGLVPTFEHIVDLETAVAVDNADMGALAYLTTPGIRGALKKAKTDAGSGLFVWGQDAATLNGYRAAVSTQVPSDLVKGSSSDAHAIIFGNWNDLIMASWGGFDIVVDPYTLATQATVRVIVNSWWDMAVRHPESFAAMKDALTS
jgi:HK97 family phage major capsid protein